MTPRTNEQLENLKDDRKKSILEAALLVFSKKTYMAASMNDVAKEARISKGNIYNYFKNKEELLKEVINMGFQVIFDYFERENITEITDEIMEKYIWFSMNSFVSDIAHWKVYFGLLMQPQVYIIMEAEIWEMAIPFMQSVQIYYEKKGSKNAYVEMRTLFAILDGIGIDYVTDSDNFPLKEATQLIIDKFIYNK